MPEDRLSFIELIKNKIPDNAPIDLETVQIAVMITDYFTTHKLLLAEISRDLSKPNEFVFINKLTHFVSKTKLKANTSSSAINKTLEYRILSQPGKIVFLTPLSTAKLCDQGTFLAACGKLVTKGLGTVGTFNANENSKRKSRGFSKLELPQAGSQEEQNLENILFDFGIDLKSYKDTFEKDNFLPSPKVSKPKETLPGASSSHTLKKRGLNSVDTKTDTQNDSSITR